MCKQVHMWISYNSVVSSSHNIFVLCGRYGMFVLWNLLQLQNLGIQLEQPVGAFLIHTFMACVQNMHSAPFSLGLLLSVHPLSHVCIYTGMLLSKFMLLCLLVGIYTSHIQCTCVCMVLQGVMCNNCRAH